jgi:hypothetical protein
MPFPRILSRRDEIVCRQAVELVTDYLEEALSRRQSGRITPDDLSPEMQADFIALYRRWQRDDQ